MFDPFAAPPPTKWNFLSLGAGVQSSALALMAAHGEITPTPDAAIFADTQAEPKAVYEWLQWLTAEIQKKPHPFPVEIVTQGELAAEALRPRVNKSGQRYVRKLVPAFIRNADGTKGIVGRSCTRDFKIAPINRHVKKLAGITRGQRSRTVTQWIGISWDELQRMKESRDRWSVNRFPLLEQRITRKQCRDWMSENGYPEPPRSACVFCPFHNDREWRRLKQTDPEGFHDAVRFDEQLRQADDPTLDGIPFLHSSLVPLSQIDFSNDFDRGQLPLWQDFNNECEGMCGV